MTVDQATASAIAQAGRRLNQEARGHIRLSRQHQKRARTLFDELRALQNQCVDLGITLDFEAPITHSQGGNSGNSNTREDTP